MEIEQLLGTVGRRQSPFPLRRNDRRHRAFPRHPGKDAPHRLPPRSLPGRKLREGRGTLTITDRNGHKMLEQPFEYRPGENSIDIAYGGILGEWSPEHPNLYVMELRLDTRDSRTMPFGIKEFRTENKQFRLNDRPCPLRGQHGGLAPLGPHGRGRPARIRHHMVPRQCRAAAQRTRRQPAAVPPGSAAAPPAGPLRPIRTGRTVRMVLLPRHAGQRSELHRAVRPLGWKPPSHTLRSASIILTTKPKATNSGGSGMP